VIENTKSHTAKEGKESQDKTLMMNRLSITTKEYDQFHVGYGRGIGIIRRRRTKKVFEVVVECFS
jgi:hypothetical protein